MEPNLPRNSPRRSWRNALSSKTAPATQRRSWGRLGLITVRQLVLLCFACHCDLSHALQTARRAWWSRAVPTRCYLMSQKTAPTVFRLCILSKRRRTQSLSPVFPQQRQLPISRTVRILTANQTMMIARILPVTRKWSSKCVEMRGRVPVTLKDSEHPIACLATAPGTTIMSARLY